MWKAALAGAFALAIGMMVLTSAQARSFRSQSLEEAPAQGTPVVTETHIARLKSALQLTPEQRVHWGPVEAALRALARRQRQDAGAGFLQRMSDRAAGMVGTAVQIRRLAAAARPLIRTLNDDQKRNAMTVVRHFGFGYLIASF